MNPFTDKEHCSLFILGTRGVPASHGGFETFAERLALHMLVSGWNVTVYCQATDIQSAPVEDVWNGIKRVTLPGGPGALGTMKFDLNAVNHALRQRGVMLVLGYNTAVFSALLRVAGKPLLTNMDGIEWKRAKWPFHGRLWLHMNEWVGAMSSDWLIADHPEIAKHLSTIRSSRKIVTIPYGADEITDASVEPVFELGAEPGKYFLAVGRIEPENNTLTMVRAYASMDRDFKFICLGNLTPNTNRYHAEVLREGDSRVIFPGAIYDTERVKALRFHAAAYCHGHSVGGTNPSLVEALGAHNPIIAHDNVFNRWVAGPGQFFFRGEEDLSAMMAFLERDTDARLSASRASRERHERQFRWHPILESYEQLLQAARV